MDAGRRQWSQTRVVALLWYCGDEECSCTMPIVEVITPNLNIGFPWIHRKRIWEGEFKSHATLEELEFQEWQVLNAAEAFGAIVE